jgi:hypothetical protein
VIVVYVGGAFTTGDGVTLNRIGAYLSHLDTFRTIQGASVVGLNGEVIGISRNPVTQELHVVGTFTDSHVTQYYAVHNALPGTAGAWQAAYSGTMPVVPVSVKFILGEGTYVGLKSPASLQAVLVPSVGAALVTLFATTSAVSVLAISEKTPDGTLYMGASTGTFAIDTAGTVTLTNAGTAKTYPTLRLAGPGTLVSIQNQTTGAAVNFDNYVMQDGEELTLVFQPGQMSFTSSFNGNIVNRILASSALIDFFLAPGENVISLFVAVDTPDSALLQWQPRYHGIEGALP